MQLVIERNQENKYQTIGSAQLLDNKSLLFEFYTLELPWRNNERNISRIPDNHYKGVKHQSPKFGNSILIQDVPNRSEILIHAGNFNYDTLGCILVGKSLKDINNDGLLDVTDSVDTITNLYNLCDDIVYVNILDKFK